MVRVAPHKSDEMLRTPDTSDLVQSSQTLVYKDCRHLFESIKHVTENKSRLRSGLNHTRKYGDAWFMQRNEK